MLCCYRRSFKVAIAVVDASADFMAATVRLVFFSIFYFIIFFAILMFCFCAAGLVISLNDIQVDPRPGMFQAKIIEWKSQTYPMLAIIAIGLLWMLFFYQDKAGFITMVAAATFYFSSNKDASGSAQVRHGWHWATFKHSGSLAMGSFLHTLIALLRIIVDMVSSKAKEENANCALQCCLCICRCLVGCIEDAVRYINKTAYAYMAVSGEHYC